MQIAVPPGGNVRVHGKSQGYLGLPVHHFRYEDGTPAMLTAWTPSPAELEALNKGANIMVRMINSSVPLPMMVYTGEPAEDEKLIWHEEAQQHAAVLMQIYNSIENVALKTKINELAQWLNKF